MKKKIILIFIFVMFSAGMAFAQSSSPSQSQTQTQIGKQEYLKAVVVKIKSQGVISKYGYHNPYQTLGVEITSGSENGRYITIDYGKDTQIIKQQEVSVGEEIILEKSTDSSGKTTYSVYDAYRLTSLMFFVAVFFVLILLVSGLKGLGSLLGMLFSLTVILLFIVPNILSGKDPLTITVIGSTIIIFVSTYLAHGISKKTSLALVSTLISLVLAASFSILAINITNLTGLGNEDFSNLLQMGPTSVINISGLFLSGIIIGTLGALNDVTTTQAATVFELKDINPRIKFPELVKRSFNVGKEHIASLVNTLILAYAGSSLGIFIFLILNPLHIPYWVILNNEILSDEIIRIIAGSIGLILSVPIVTLISALSVSTKPD